MLIYLLLSLFATTQASFASHHVHNFVNYSISPCDDFYRHVCSVEMPEDETVQKQSEKFWLDLAEKLNSRSLNNPMLDDITAARDNFGCPFEENRYLQWLEHRCSSDFDCQFEEFQYFFKLYEKSTEHVDDSLKFYSIHGASTQNITQAARATSRMVELLYNSMNVENDFEDAVSTYLRLQDRLYVVELVTKNDMVSLQEIQQLTDQLKTVMLQKFKDTKWMNVDNQFGFNILWQFSAILEKITVQTEFDIFDKDMTILKKINRDMYSHYFENSKRETGCNWFDVMHAFQTTAIQLNEMSKTSDEEEIYFRLSQSLVYNAFNHVESHIILVLAPTFYPLLHNSSGTATLAFAANILGHELIHSFVTDALLNRSSEFDTESKCLMDHYKQSCLRFAEGECDSGQKTFLEDAADIEGVRAAYELLKQKFTPKELNQLEYHDLEITREQSFFYSIAMRSCSNEEHPIEDTHSPYNIRVNALVSQMPEFTSAFACQADNALYAHKDQQCYLFGKQSTGKRRDLAEKISKITKIPKMDDAFRLLNGL